MRFFIALEIPNECRAQLHSVQLKMNTLIPQLRLTVQEKLHLTLAFVGEQPDSIREELADIIAKAVEGIPPFEITPAYLDAFPNLHHPQVLWVGVKGDIDKLLLIRERIKDGLANLGLSVDERRFTPHITIAKLTRGFKVAGQTEAALEQAVAIGFDPINITSIKLFESVPDQGFHRHNTLAEVKLTG